MPKVRSYISFTKARKFARSLGLRSGNQWQKYMQGADLAPVPDTIPARPEKIYPKWKGWEDWLGKSYEGRIEQASYKDAKAFAQDLKLNSGKEWLEYVRGKSQNKKLPARPKNIPMNPPMVYKKQWEGWALFLGNPQNKKNRNFRSFKDAREYTIGFGFKTAREWKDFIKGKRTDLSAPPIDIPLAPNVYYKEWQGWDHFLGKVVIKRSYFSYNQARDAAIKAGIKTMGQWRKHVEKKLPQSQIILSQFLPKYPDKVYSKTGKWQGWPEFTGQPEKKLYLGPLLPYAKAKKFARMLHLKNRRQWFKYVKGDFNHLPPLLEGIPKSPSGSYKKDWKGWGDFLGTDNTFFQVKNFWSYEKAKAYLAKLKIRNVTEWRLYIKGKLPGRDLKPEQIPSEPRYYGEKWQGYNDFLSTGRSQGKRREYVGIKEARIFALQNGIHNRKEWIEYIKSKKGSSHPDHIPRWPDDYYRGQEQWKSWKDFFEVEKRVIKKK